MSSQGREDAILARIFGQIGTTNRYAVEIGARDGVKGSNTHALRLQGWTCLLLDTQPKAPIVHKAHLTRENIEQVLAHYRVPSAFDLLSIDVDGNDFHLWQALVAYAPRVVVIEYNSCFHPDESIVMPYDPHHRWDRTAYYGASAAALAKLGRQKGYALVEVEPRTNLFFVKQRAATPYAYGWEELMLPPADPYGYPSAGARPWEVY